MTRHLTSNQIEQVAEGRVGGVERRHLAGCEICRTRVESANKFERVLRTTPREQPPFNLAARIDAAVPLERSKPPSPLRLLPAGMSAGGALVIALVLVYQTLAALQAGGALTFVDAYTNQPEIITMYPNESLAALAETIPFTEIVLTLVFLVITVALVRAFVGALTMVQPSHSNGRGVA